MCLECLRDGYIRASTDHEFSMLYEKDAVEYIYQAVRRKKHEHFLYHLSSNDVVNELELAAHGSGSIEKRGKYHNGSGRRWALCAFREPF